MKTYVLTLVLLFLGAPLVLWAQNSSITVSGYVADQTSHSAMGYVNVIIKKVTDSSFVTGSISGEDGRFKLVLKPGRYVVQVSFTGYVTRKMPLFVGSLS